MKKSLQNITLNDQALVKLFYDNEKAAFNQLFDSYYSLFFNTSLRIVADTSLAEDVVQEVLLNFWQKRGWENLQSSLIGYLRKAVINKSIDAVRANKISFKDLEEAHYVWNDRCPASDLEFSELEGQIRNAIQNLPPRCKAVFILSRLENLSNKEVAEQLDISLKTVENQMTKALKLLRSEVGFSSNNYFIFLFL